MCESVCVHVHTHPLSCVPLFVTPWTVAHQAPLAMGFSRQEYWSGLQFLPPGDLPRPEIKPRSPALLVDFLQSEPQGIRRTSQMKRHLGQGLRMACIQGFCVIWWSQGMLPSRYIDEFIDQEAPLSFVSKVIIEGPFHRRRVGHD